MELEKTSHSVYKIRYHMVTAVKYRKLLFNSEIEECIQETLRGISERYEILIDEVGFDQNHIHIFSGAPPRLSPLRIISIITSITARKVFERLPNLKDGISCRTKLCFCILEKNQPEIVAFQS